jgi:hypothetical protein
MREVPDAHRKRSRNTAKGQGKRKLPLPSRALNEVWGFKKREAAKQEMDGRDKINASKAFTEEETW